MIKLNQEVINIFYEYMAAGKTLTGTAIAVGVSRTCALKWRDKGREAQQQGKNNLYRKFYERIKQAEGAHRDRLLQEMRSFAEAGERLTKIKVTTSPTGDVTRTQEISENNKFNATKWLLERKFGYDMRSTDASERTLSRVIRVARKALPENHFYLLMTAIVEDTALSQIDIDLNEVPFSDVEGEAD